MGSDLNQILQQQLRDVHLPQAISWWPPAVGWWILLVLIIALLTLLSWRTVRHIRQNRYRKLAQTELQKSYLQWQQNADTTSYLQGANAILKRILIHLEGATLVPSATGEVWVAMLNSYVHQPLSEASSQALAKGSYQPNPDADIAELHQQLSNWIRAHKLSIQRKNTVTDHV